MCLDQKKFKSYELEKIEKLEIKKYKKNKRKRKHYTAFFGVTSKTTPAATV